MSCHTITNRTECGAFKPSCRNAEPAIVMLTGRNGRAAAEPKPSSLDYRLTEGYIAAYAIETPNVVILTRYLAVKAGILTRNKDIHLVGSDKALACDRQRCVYSADICPTYGRPANLTLDRIVEIVIDVGTTRHG